MGGVLGGPLFFGGGNFCAYVAMLGVFEGGVELSVPTWDDFWERGSSGWSFLPPFPIVSHSAFAYSELTVGDERGVGFFLPAGVGETTGASVSGFLLKKGERV